MKSFSVLRVLLLLTVVELEATSLSESSCLKRNLTVTVDDILKLYIDGIEITGLQNADVYAQPDIVQLPCTTRLIAIHGRNSPSLKKEAAILASTDDEYVLTNSSWKCSNVSHFGWEEIDFDDSAWMSAVEYGGNGEAHWFYIPGITNSSAQWIWLRQWNRPLNSSYEDMDMEVYCRKRLAPSYCLSSPCAFGGTCIDEPNGGYCICAPGYTGQNCSAVINYCDSSPCASGGSCLPILNGYVCQCPPGYTDDNCEFMINYCESSPCANGGSCEPVVNGYACSCSPGYTGDHCQYDNTSSSVCQPVACSSDDIAIAMSALFGVSFAVNITILITWLCNTFRVKKDPFNNPENVLPTEITDLSSVSSAPSTYEELRRPDESQLHQNNYEKLTSTISSNNDQQSTKQN